MFNLKVIFFAFLLLATDVLAARINYSAKYHDGKKVARTSKNAEIADELAPIIVQQMHTWSGGAYQAGLSKYGFVQVVNAQVAPSKGAASAQVQQMQTLIHQHANAQHQKCEYLHLFRSSYLPLRTRKQPSSTILTRLEISPAHIHIGIDKNLEGKKDQR
ncbi:hypothetical protein F4805DRAFT_436234 [Annulohypoxylon moriforme]|nr:hypothetical protein F4805DRAFT_436234 [Annulohypoxylon moriforme]